MPLYSNPEHRYAAQGFSVSRCGCAHTLRQAFWRSFLESPRYTSPSGQKYERGYWYAHIFPVLRQVLKSEIPFREQFVQLPPWTEMFSTSTNDSKASQELSSLRIKAQGWGLQSLKSHSPKFHDKGSVLRKDCKATQALALHVGCYQFCFCPLSFFSHRLDTSRWFFTPDSHFPAISSRMWIVTF